jgi:hypothetical protein
MADRIAFVSDLQPVTPNFVRQDVLRLLNGIMLEARHEAVRIHYIFIRNLSKCS